MKDPDLTYFLNKARDGRYHLGRASYYLGLLKFDQEGSHYVDEALKYIDKAKDMINRYREFIQEDYDEEDICGTGDADAERNTDGMLG